MPSYFEAVQQYDYQDDRHPTAQGQMEARKRRAYSEQPLSGQPGESGIDDM